MLITINILSALAIVMALFIPYFILLHLNNKLRKEVEGALNRVLELKVYSEGNREQLIDFVKSLNINFEGQDKNWENQKNISKSFTESFLIADRNFKAYDENFENIVNEIEILYELVNKKQTLKKILENPIEVKKPACETKLKLKKEVIENDIQTTAEIVNKVDFNHGKSNFKIGDVFRKTEDTVFISRDGGYIKILNLNNTYGKNIYNKFLQLNEN
jgi:hypothetical protein